MSGNPESKTSFLEVIWGFEYFSRQRAPAGHFPLPPHHSFLKSDFEIPLSLRKFVFFACLEVDIFSKSFFNIKNRGATAPPIFQLFFPEKTAFESSLDLFVGTLSSFFQRIDFERKKPICCMLKICISFLIIKNREATAPPFFS